MKKLTFVVIALSWLFLTQTPIWGVEVSYVIDSTTITMRTGPSIQNKIVRMLRSGQAVQVLDAEGDWSYIRLLNRDEEIEGWVLSQYLITREPWEIQAQSLSKDNKQLKDTLSQVESRLKEINEEKDAILKTLEETTRSLDQIQIEYNALKIGSAEYLKVKGEHDRLKELHRISEKKVETLSHENDILRASQQYKWIGMGGLLLLFGLLIGIIIGNYKKKEKSSLMY